MGRVMTLPIPRRYAGVQCTLLLTFAGAFQPINYVRLSQSWTGRGLRVHVPDSEVIQSRIEDSVNMGLAQLRSMYSWGQTDADVQYLDKIKKIFCRSLAYLDEAEIARVFVASEIAFQVHRGQTRNSGEPYVEHPIAVALILAHLRMDGVHSL